MCTSSTYIFVHYNTSFTMLCEIGTQHGLFALWATMTVLGLISMLILSSFLFYPYYVKPTFERWQVCNFLILRLIMINNGAYHSVNVYFFTEKEQR